MGLPLAEDESDSRSEQNAPVPVQFDVLINESIEIGRNPDDQRNRRNSLPPGFLEHRSSVQTICGKILRAMGDEHFSKACGRHLRCMGDEMSGVYWIKNQVTRPQSSPASLQNSHSLPNLMDHRLQHPDKNHKS